MALKKAGAPTRKAFSDRLKEFGSIDKELVVFESDIGKSTYTNLFGEAFPERYFNMGIAEINTLASAAGFALNGRNVVVGGYSIFLSMRAVEVIRSFICYPHLNVKILASHGGLTAAIDGVTHQATEDIAIMTTLPEMKVLVPACPASARAALDIAMATPGPVFTRLMRDTLFELHPEGTEFHLGGSHKVREGKDITLAGYGDVVFQLLEAADLLAAKGIEADVLDLYSVKPYDKAAVLASVRKTGALMVAENHQMRNGIAYELATMLMKEGVQAKFDHAGLADCFAESGDYFKMIDKYGFSGRVIAEKSLVLLGKKQ